MPRSVDRRAADHERARRTKRSPESALPVRSSARMPNDTADLVLTGGRIFTGDAAKTWAQALAVRGNRIVAVGSDARRQAR